MKKKLSEKNRKRLFWIFTTCLGLINFYYFSHENYFIKLMIRIPQVLILFYLYRKFVNSNISTMAAVNNKYKLKGKLHYSIIIVGIVEFILLMTIKFKTKPSNTESLDGIQIIINDLVTHPVITFSILLSMLIIIIPTIYAIIQGLFGLRNLTFWVYSNKFQWFIPFIIMEDILFVGFVSLTQ